jgi:hypothetical protein
MRRTMLFVPVILILSVRGFCGGFSTLMLGVGARGTGMGMAYTAIANDASGGFWNPAGLLVSKKGDFLFSVHRWIQGVQGGFLALEWGRETRKFGIQMLYMEVSDIEHRIGPSPDPLSTFSAHEIITGFSYALRLRKNFSMGLTLKLFYEKIYIEEALGFGGDIGFLWEIQKGGLRLGGVMQNIGKTDRLKTESIPLPLVGKLGAAYPIQLFRNQCILAVDLVQEKDMPFHVHAGCEFNWQEMLCLRFGYQTGYETRRLTAGLGVALKGYRLDYSYMPLLQGLGDSHRFSLGIDL